MNMTKYMSLELQNERLVTHLNSKLKTITFQIFDSYGFIYFIYLPFFQSFLDWSPHFNYNLH